MNKLSKLAVVVALTAASASAGAWWSAPLLGYCEQQRLEAPGSREQPSRHRTDSHDRLRLVSRSFGAGGSGLEDPANPFARPTPGRPERLERVTARHQAHLQRQAHARQRAWAEHQAQAQRQASVLRHAFAERQAKLQQQARAWQQARAESWEAAREQFRTFAERQRQWAEPSTEAMPFGRPEPVFADPVASGPGDPNGSQGPQFVTPGNDELQTRYEEMRQRHEALRRARIEGYNKRRAAVLERGNRREI